MQLSACELSFLHARLLRTREREREREREGGDKHKQARKQTPTHANTHSAHADIHRLGELTKRPPF